MAEIATARYIAEFVGTFLLVFTVGCNVNTGSPVWAATSIACILMVSIYAFGGVSGANFNPAVSVALGLSKKMAGGWIEVLFYCLVQISGGICAAVGYAVVCRKDFNLAPSEGFGFLEAGLAEFLYTCMLCFVVLNCAASRKNGCESGNEFFGLAIGFVIIAGGYGAGHISGGAFNPAVAISIDLVSALDHGVVWGPIYCLFEFAGAAAAVGLFHLVRPDDFGGSSKYTLATRCIAEAIGTFYLVLTVGLNVIGGSPAGAFSIAAALMCMIFSLGNCSGAHFNPAVTVAILLSQRGRVKPKEAGAYIGSQVGGGILAAFVYSLMEKGKTFPLGPVQDHSWFAVAVAEIVFTFVLCFVVLSVVTVQDKKVLTQFFGLAIGSCVTVGGFAIGGVSGGSLNPAVSIGISSSHILNGGAFYKCVLYTIFELAGGALAAGVFKVTRPSEYPKGAALTA